jgi:two-component system, OmpR family, alkaline phosphatase synthesis response regulator PhoP
MTDSRPLLSSSQSEHGPAILVVEDDPSILLGLRMNLVNAGYTVRIAQDGTSGLAEILREKPALVILDLMLPGLNGLEVLSRLRSTDRTLPVLVLTALGAEKDKVRGLDLGANDYVTKPFSVAELLARVRALLRSSIGNGSDSERVLRGGSIEAWPASLKAAVDGEPVELNAREFALLVFLMERPERVLTRDQILANVWHEDYAGTDRTVDNFISNLRRKLKEDPDHPRHVRTVWGIGYRFVP